MRLAPAVLVVLAYLCGTAAAQSHATTADVRGTVRDPSGALVPGATVLVVDAARNLRRTVITEANGRFGVLALPPGRYDILISLTGFATQVFEDLDLRLGSSLDLDVRLTLGKTAEEISVRARVPSVDTQRTAISSSVDLAQLEQLPINGRNFVSLSLITPAVTVDRVPQQGAAAGSGLTFVGQRARSNNITVDGVDNNEASVGGVRATFSQDAIQEFQVVAHSYAAEFGKATGGIVNIVTKSGTNTIAGNGFLYFRDEVLNAKEYFERYGPDGSRVDLPKAPFGQKQFGATIGGPIKRDRTFYFGAFERLGINANNFVTIDNSQPIEVFGKPVGTVVDLLRNAGFPVETGHVPYVMDTDSVVIKADHRFGTNRHATFRYSFADAHHGSIDPFGGIVAESRGGALDSTDHMFAGGHTSVHGRALNELRVQIARRDQGVFPRDPTCNGGCDRDDEGGPTIEIAGVASAGRHRFYPQLRDYVRYQVVNTLARVSERHELKTGFDAGWQQGLTSTLPLHYGGRYVFAPLPAVPGITTAPVTATQAFALGLPAAYAQGYGNPATKLGSGDLSLFVQDTWRLRDNLTAKLGLRYQTQFWSDASFDVPGVGPYDFPTDRNDLAPRVAISWNPGSGRRTIVHGAYGVYFDRQIVGTATIADIIDGTPAGSRTRVLRFPQTIAAWNAPGRRLPEPATAYPSSVISLDPAMVTPYAHHSSVGLDRVLSPDVTLSVNSVWVRGFNQLGAIDYNPIVPSLGAGRRPLDVGGVAGTSASVLQYTSFGETWYRALLVTLEKRFDRRYQLLANYTLAKAEDTSSDFQTSVMPQTNGRGRDPDNPHGLPLGFDPLSERGPALHDQRHRMVVSGTYAAPHNLAVSAIFTAATGTPYNILAGADLNGDGDGGAFPADRARRVPGDPSTSVARNSGRLPSQVTVDVRITQTVRLSGERRIDILAEVFNLFNRANFLEVNNVFGTGSFPDQPLPTYGQFQRSAPARQFQVGIRLAF